MEIRHISKTARFDDPQRHISGEVRKKAFSETSGQKHETAGKKGEPEGMTSRNRTIRKGLEICRDIAVFDRSDGYIYIYLYYYYIYITNRRLSRDPKF